MSLLAHLVITLPFFQQYCILELICLNSGIAFTGTLRVYTTDVGSTEQSDAWQRQRDQCQSDTWLKGHARLNRGSATKFRVSQPEDILYTVFQIISTLHCALCVSRLVSIIRQLNMQLKLQRMFRRGLVVLTVTCRFCPVCNAHRAVYYGVR